MFAWSWSVCVSSDHEGRYCCYHQEYHCIMSITDVIIGFYTQETTVSVVLYYSCQRQRKLQSMKKLIVFSTLLVSLHLLSMNDTEGVDLIMLLNKLCSCHTAGVLLLFRLLLCHFLSSHIQLT